MIVKKEFREAFASMEAHRRCYEASRRAKDKAIKRLVRESSGSTTVDEMRRDADEDGKRAYEEEMKKYFDEY